jgi:hypothetical protein
MQNKRKVDMINVSNEHQFRNELLEMDNANFMQEGKSNFGGKVNMNKNIEGTMINLHSGEEPIGLDLNNFMNNVCSDQTIHSISTSNDLPILSEVIIYL